MDGVVSTIIGTILSGFSCNFLLNILNNNMWSVFNVIREDLGKLTNETRRILSFLGFILVILITILLKMILSISSFEGGLILGFLLSIKETCFKGSNMKTNKR